MCPTAQPNQSLTHGFAMLELLAQAREPLATGAVAAALGLHKSVCSRMLLTLHDLGYAHRVGRGRWRAHVGLLALSAFGLKNSPLSRCQEQLLALIRQVRCVVAVGCVWKGNVVYLFHYASAGKVTGFGNIFPVRSSSIGRLLTARRRPAYALVRDVEPGRFSLAVPFTFDGLELGLAIAGPQRLYHGAATVTMLQEFARRLAPPPAP